MKFCRDCKHLADGGFEGGSPICSHDKSISKIDPVHGANHYHSALYARTDPDGACGVDAKLFEENFSLWDWVFRVKTLGLFE